MKMSSDIQIRMEIETELRSAPNINETGIAVDVNHGDVTLSGFAGSYLSKYQAEIEARRIRGVTAVANHIAVKPLGGSSRDLAQR
jgi:osmotically-inducible protein OsmY